MSENKRFTKEQIANYVRALKAGDAVYFKFGGEWQEVKEETYPRDVIPSLYLNDKFQDNTFLLVTLERAKLRGGEKLVWLGNDNINLTQGKVYKVSNTTPEPFIYLDDGTVCYLNDYQILHQFFGFIPRFEDAKKRSKTKTQKTTTDNKPCPYDVYEQIAMNHNLTVEELCFILDEVDKGRKQVILNSLIDLRRKWIEDGTRGI